MNNVSIIIPSYNQQEYLREAIESAITQTTSCEVVVVDDGSTDDSPRIAKEYEPEVKIVQQVNKGLSSARNTGIMNATGEWIFPLDADDKIAEFCIEKLLKIALDTGADIVAPSMQCFGLTDETIIIDPNPQRRDFLAANRLPYACLIKKSILLECGGYSPKMIWGAEDLHLWFDLLGRGKKLVTTPEVLFQYRTKKQSMWRETAKHSKEYFAQIFKDFPELEPKEL